MNEFMAEQKPSEYIPKSSWKLIQFKTGNQALKFSIAKEGIEWMLANVDPKTGRFRGVITERKSVGQYGDTHCAKKDTWEPGPNRQQSQPGPRTPQNLAQKIWPDDPKPAQERDDTVPF